MERSTNGNLDCQRNEDVGLTDKVRKLYITTGHKQLVLTTYWCCKL